MTSLLQKARESGTCPPSLIKEEHANDADAFQTEALGVVGAAGLSLSRDASTVDLFDSLLKKVNGIESVPGPDEGSKKAALELRRCLILAIVGSTSHANPTVDGVLERGYLTHVKTWLDDILKGKVGGVDLLLHLLKNIADLPVWTSVVKTSGLGKAIGSIEKNRICSGSPNEGPIKERVALVKDHWKASVKARKIIDPQSKVGEKREPPVVPTEAASPAAKRTKVSESPKSSYFSSLVKKASGGESLASMSSAKANPSTTNGTKVATKSTPANPVSPAKKKKVGARVKWSDHFGEGLSEVRFIEGDNVVQSGPTGTSAPNESWNDRKKRDREKEKALLGTMKKAKLLDDDDEDLEPVVPGMKATVPWTIPALLPENPDTPKPHLESTEVSSQSERMKITTGVQYFSEKDVPSSPAPLSDIEQALDMTAQASANVVPILFFVSQLPQAAEPPAVAVAHNGMPPSLAPATRATAEFVQSMGLPMFLVGQDTQALHTLVNSGFLNSLIDASGMYDQARLMSLVQTLSGSAAAAPPPRATPYAPPPPQALNTGYGAGGGYSSYGAENSYGSQRPAPGMRGNDEGNLHVSGYGPTTTQADIIGVFSQFVIVKEVVMKGSFCFVNTNDPFNAERAREALAGTLLGGLPLRINPAQRKGREGPPSGPGGSSAYGPSSYGPPGGAPSFPPSHHGGGFPNDMGMPPPSQGMPPPSQGMPPPAQGMPPPVQPIGVDHVRDSRGNAPTKNLFVAGYGAGTSEGQIRQVFGVHVTVVGVVLKGNFTFVNTGSREDAVLAREMLQGQMLNGGPLRINFAKETGRLGTSFDLTYNERSGPNARRPPPPGPPPNAPSYYGRT